jgi:hypothetical protein
VDDSPTIDAHVHGGAAAAAPEPIASIGDIDGAVAVLDETHARRTALDLTLRKKKERWPVAHRVPGSYRSRPRCR